MDSPRQKARQLAIEHLERGDFLDWFEALYARADGDPSLIPWADLAVNPNLADWLERRPSPGHGRKALVVACGLGDDAEHLASFGFDVTAFDIAPTAIRWCRRRFPDSSVHYTVADLLDPPPDWSARFDLVLEAYTLQNFPSAHHEPMMRALAGFLAPAGTLLVISRGRDPDEEAPGPLWPLARHTLDFLKTLGLREVAFDDYIEREDPPVRRFRAEYSA